MAFYALKYAARQLAIVAVVLLIPALGFAVIQFFKLLAYWASSERAWGLALAYFWLVYGIIWALASAVGLWGAHRLRREVGVTFDELRRLTVEELKKVHAEHGI